MGSQERREREREEVRAKILDAARELFVEQGYESVTMRKIAAKIEYTATALYFHFKDKESLLRELCMQDFLTLAKKMNVIVRVDDPLERLRKMGHAYMDFAIEHPNHYRLMFMTPVPHFETEDMHEHHGNPEQDAYAFLVAAVKDAIESKALRPELTDEHLVAQAIWSAGHGVVSLEIAKKNDAWVDWRPVKKRARLVTDAMIRGLARKPE